MRDNKAVGICIQLAGYVLGYNTCVIKSEGYKTDQHWAVKVVKKTHDI